MTTARDIMTGGAECARTTDTLVDAAQKMRDLDVGALPICGEDDRLKGMLTDRDIVLRCVADGRRPQRPSESRTTPATRPSPSEPMTQSKKHCATMTKHGVRRLPVIDGHDLVGVVSQADIARNLPDDQIAPTRRSHLLRTGQQLSRTAPRLAGHPQSDGLATASVACAREAAKRQAAVTTPSMAGMLR